MDWFVGLVRMKDSLFDEFASIALQAHNAPCHFITVITLDDGENVINVMIGVTSFHNYHTWEDCDIIQGVCLHITMRTFGWQEWSPGSTLAVHRVHGCVGRRRTLAYLAEKILCLN